MQKAKKTPNIWQYLTQYRKESIASPLLKMAEATFELLVPLVVAKIVDEGIANSNKPVIYGCVGLMILFAVLGTCIAIFAQYFAAKAATGFAANLRGALFRKIQTFSYEDVDNLGTGALLTRMNSDINAVQSAVNLFLRLFLRSPFIVGGAIVMSCVVDPKTSLLFLGIVAVLGIIVFIITKTSLPIYKLVQEKLERLTLTTKESMEGAKVIRAFSSEEQEEKRFISENGEVYEASLKAGKRQSFMSPVTTVVINIGIVLLLYVSGLKVNAGTLTQGETIALLNYMGQILVELVKLANLIVLLTKAGPCVTRLNDVIFRKVDEKDGYIDDGVGYVNQIKDGEILFSLENVGFTYAGSSEESLTNISFDIKKGETIGIIGGTGAGKTTLLEVMAGYYKVTSGEIKLAGKNINDFKSSSYKNLISMVPQKAALFSGTVESNLKVASQNATVDEMEFALDSSMSSEFVSAKGGLEAKVSAGGKNFSGGQKQRLTIARALTKIAPVYMLDDSFSALDMATEKKLAEKLNEIPSNPTMILVSQRASSLRYADRILVLEDGVVDAFGTKEELLKTSKVFKEIYETQYEGGAS